MKQVLNKGNKGMSFSITDLTKMKQVLLSSSRTTINQQLYSNSKMLKGVQQQQQKQNFDRQSEYFKYKFQSKFSDRYTVHASPDSGKCIKAKINLLGSQGRIFGFQDDDFNSNDVLLNEVEKTNPNSVILGHMSYTDLDYLYRGEMKYQDAPKIEPVQAEQIIARKKMNKFLLEDMTSNRRFYNEFQEEQEDYTIYEIDKLLKRKIARPQLSIAKYVCSEHSKKLFFGSPNPLLLIEDMADSMSLKELKGIFDHCLQEYYDLMAQDRIINAEHPIDVHQNLQNIAFNLYGDKLHKNLITYQASLLRKCSKLYKENVLLVNSLIVEKVKQSAMNPDIKEFDEIFKREYNEKNETLQEKLQKVSIITHLFSREFQLYMEYGQGDSLMKQMWNGLYYEEQSSDNHYQQIFTEQNQPYRQKLTKLYDHDLNRLKEENPSGRQYIESYDDCLKRFDVKMERNYRFVANPLRERLQLVFLFDNLVRKVFENIAERERKGIDQTQTRILLKQIMNEKESDQGQTIESAQLLKELMIEANAQLNFVALPEEIFGKYKELIKTTQYEEFKKQLGEDPRLSYRKELINQDNQIKRGVYTQLKDGSVPSFEEFATLKEKIIKTNQGVGLKTNPIKFKEKTEETIKQYMELEELGRKHPKMKQRVKKLQDKLDKGHLPLELIQEQKDEDIYGQRLYLDVQGNPFTEEKLEPTQNLVYSTNGEQLPFDISKKTVEELREMGFKDIANFEMRPSQNGQGGMQPYLSKDEREKLRNTLRKMEQGNQEGEKAEGVSDDDNDPDYYQDDMDYKNYTPQQKLRQQMIDKKIQQQKKIDDMRIAIIHKALEKGIPLPDDEVYLEMIELYPFYKTRLQQKQAMISEAKRNKEKLEKGEKLIKYKFEQKKGKRNLLPEQREDIIDIDPASEEQVKKEQSFEYYSKLLEDYQNECDQIKQMTQNLEPDVVTEQDAKEDIEEHELEEKETEKRLGNKYLTKIEEDEAGSLLESVNRKNQGEMLIDNFVKNVKKTDKEEYQKMMTSGRGGNKSVNDSGFDENEMFRDIKKSGIQ